MYNSHIDPNISLALNILDGCWQVQAVYRNKSHLGQDVNPDNIHDVFRCAYQLATQMHKEAVSGLYYELAPSLFLGKKAIPLSSSDEEEEPEKNSASQPYFDPIRRLSLLPSFIVKKIKPNGDVALPFAKSNVPEHHNQYYKDNPYYSTQLLAVPLSYGNEDYRWLTFPDDDHVVKVFPILQESLRDVLGDALEGQPWFEIPQKISSPDRWLKQQLMDPKNYIIPAVLYLLNFFPYKSSATTLSKPTVNVTYILNALGANRPMGDSMLFMEALFLPLLKYGPTAIRKWINHLKTKGR